jgi:hypothetical protein
MVSWFGPQNQVCYGLSVAPQNRWKGDSVRHASRSSGLLHMEASWVRVFQSDLKTDGGVAWMVHVESSWRLRRGHVEDGRVDAMGYIRPSTLALVFFLYLSIEAL